MRVYLKLCLRMVDCERPIKLMKCQHDQDKDGKDKGSESTDKCKNQISSSQM